MKDRKITWHSVGNVPELEDCKTEGELSDKMDEFMCAISEDLGDVVYQAGGKTYVLGLVLSHLELDEIQDEGDILN